MFEAENIDACFIILGLMRPFKLTINEFYPYLISTVILFWLGLVKSLALIFLVCFLHLFNFKMVHCDFGARVGALPPSPCPPPSIVSDRPASAGGEWAGDRQAGEKNVAPLGHVPCPCGS